MALLDRIRQAGARVSHEVAGTAGPVVYLRQLLRGDRVPPAASVASPAAPPARDRSRDDAPPVLLIHGYLANRGSLHLLERRLVERGHVVISYRLHRMSVGDIRESAALIARKVESLLSQIAVDRIDIVGHSVGGLVGLYYVKRLGGRHRVRKLILMGSPAGGTWSAVFGLVTVPFGKASVQLLPGSTFLRELADAPLPPGVDVVTVAGVRDLFAPLRSAVLEGVRNVALPTGHSGLLVEEEVVDVLDSLLKEQAPASKPAGA